MKEYKLTEVCDFQGGTQPPKSEWINEARNGYVRMLQIRDFTQGKAQHIEYVKDNTKVNKCNEDDILIARYGASIGKIVTGLEGAYNVALIKTIPNENILTKKFLQSVLKSPVFQNFILSIGARAAQAGFNKEDLSRFKIFLPSLQEQIRIAEILTQAENLITQRKESILLLDELLRSTFLEMFGDPVRNEKGWKQDYLQNYSIKISSGSTPLGGKEVYQRKGKFFIRSQNVRMNFLDYSDIYCISDEIHNKMKRTWIKNEDVLLNITGASIGRIATYYGEDDNANVNQHVCIIRTIKEKLNPRFLEYQIAENHFQKVCIGASTGGTRESFTFEMIKKFNIILPPLELQTRFAIIVKKVETLKTEYQTSLKELENMYGVLSQKAFKGELKVTEYTNNEVLGMVAETKGEY